MNVGELIESLRSLDPESEAYVMVADARGAYAPLTDVRDDSNMGRATLIGEG